MPDRPDQYMLPEAFVFTLRCGVVRCKRRNSAASVSSVSASAQPKSIRRRACLFSVACCSRGPRAHGSAPAADVAGNELHARARLPPASQGPCSLVPQLRRRCRAPPSRFCHRSRCQRGPRAVPARRALECVDAHTWPLLLDQTSTALLVKPPRRPSTALRRALPTATPYAIVHGVAGVPCTASYSKIDRAARTLCGPASHELRQRAVGALLHAHGQLQL